MAHQSGYERLVNFTDAVVAIAATLLILPVVDAASTLGNGNVDTFLRNIFPEFIMFALSFVIIINAWLDHHRLFRRIDKFDSTLMMMNFLWVFGVVVMPLPTALIIVGDQTTVLAIGFYIGTLFFISAMQLALAEHIQHHPELENAHDKEPIRMLGARISVVYMAIAWVVGVTIPAIGLWALMLLLLIPFTVKVVKHKQAKP